MAKKYVIRTIEENEVHYTIDAEMHVETITGKFNKKAFMAGIKSAYPEALIKITNIIPMETRFRMLESDFVRNAEREIAGEFVDALNSCDKEAK